MATNSNILTTVQDLLILGMPWQLFLLLPGCLNFLPLLHSDTLGGNLNDDELEEAIRLLDTNRNQLIEFVEFVDFWVNKVRSINWRFFLISLKESAINTWL